MQPLQPQTKYFDPKIDPLCPYLSVLVSVLLSALVERFSVFPVREIFFYISGKAPF